MRVRRLELIRYGRFTNQAVDLPPGDPDLHIVFGPNEAGKSTVMSALEDLLFGIPSQSKLNFVHSYKDMRIGGTLESDGRSLSVQRRKGTRNTLLAADNLPFANGEMALAPYLGDANRDRLERMFSLDHTRLRRGGREILEAKGDVGQALFSAGSGFQDLRKCLRELEGEADQLWSRRRSAKRKYFQAHDRLKTAESDLRAQMVSAAAWRDLKREYEACKTASEELHSQIQAKDTEQRKLNRIRRQARFVHDKIRLEAEISEFGDVSGIAQDASQTLQRAEQDRHLAARRIEDYEADLKRAKRERAELNWDERLLLRAEDIDRLYKRWIQAQAGKADLPKREAELAAEEGKFRDLARDLGWTEPNVSSLIARIPAKSGLARVRTLLKQRSERLAEIRSTQRAVSEAEDRLAVTKRRLRRIGARVDVSRLAALVAATRRDSGDIRSRGRLAKSELESVEAEIQTLFRSLRPTLGTPEIAGPLPAPSKQQVQAHRDMRLELDRQRARCRERLESKESKLARLEQARDRIQANERPVSRNEVIRLRADRDSGWVLVRRKYVAGQGVSEADLRHFTRDSSGLAEAYENSVRAADRAADRSIETASATARLTEIERSIESVRGELGTLEDERVRLAEQSNALDSSWKQLWAEAPFEPLDPDAMLSWLDAREDLQQALRKQVESERKLATLREEEEGAIEAVASELRALGTDVAAIRDKGLIALLELATDKQQRHEQAARTRVELEAASEDAAAEAEAKRKEAARSESAKREWQSDWSAVVSALGFTQVTNPESVEAQVDVIDEMRPVQAEIANLREKRIALIQRDIADFERDLRKVVGAIAPGLARKDPDDAVPELRRLLQRSRDARDAALAKDGDIATLEDRLRSQDEARRKSEQEIFALQDAAGVETVEGLKLEIQKAERAERCRSQLSEALERLRTDGDGLTVEDQQEECLAVDLDEAKSRAKALSAEIGDLRNRQLQARDNLREAEKNFNAVGGSDAAALTEGARHNALAEIGEIAGQYIRTRSAGLILQWAIERNRRERQAPMLKRAGELFSELTLGSFEALELDFDEKDRARIVGLRPSGERVEVDGMSSGSGDQLYLALRVAALEDQVDGTQPLPFVADDLFINFDDQRSAAGLRVLEHLGRRCQVIFFTHHEHLLEVANRAIPESVRVWRMTS